MCGHVIAFVAENEAALALSEMAAAQATAATALYEEVAAARSGTAKRTNALSAAAKAARTVLNLLPALLGPLARVVTRLADVDLQAAAMLSSRQLRKLRPLAFIGVVGSVLGSAAQPDGPRASQARPHGPRP